MQDIFKAVVLSQRVLIVTCLTIFVFALSENEPMVVYKNALSEFREIGPSLQLVSNATNNKRTKFYFESEMFNEISRKFNGLTTKNTKFEFNDDQTLGSIYTVPGLYENLDEFRIYFLRIGNTIPVFQPDMNSLKQAITKIQVNESNVEEATVSIALVDPFNEIRKSQPVLQQIIPLMGAEMNIYINLKYEDGSSSAHSLSENSNATSNPVPFDDIKKQLHTNGVLSRVNGVLISLPDLRLLSQEINGIDTSKLEAVLELNAIRESKEPSSNLEFFGIRISQALAYVVAPLVVISTLLYMLAHLRQAKRLLALRPCDLHNNAWIGLYDDTYSVSIYTLIILALPLASIGSILYTANIDNTLKVQIGLTAIFILGGVAILVLAISKYLRKYEANDLS